MYCLFHIGAFIGIESLRLLIRIRSIEAIEYRCHGNVCKQRMRFAFLRKRVLID